VIIDIHGHVTMPSEAFAYQANLVSNRARPWRAPAAVSDDAFTASARSHVDMLDAVGTDLQLLSPRPFAMMHSIKPERVVRLWTEYVNDLIAQQCRLFAGRFRGVAGLPQFRDSSPRGCLDELERCVKELGFVGCIINPDPLEGDGGPPPGLGDPFWYPLYERLVELDVPALVHSASCVSPRESYTLHFINEESIAILELLESPVFDEFPTLQVVISHAGGAIPYHMGRFRAWSWRSQGVRFDDTLRRLHFDTCNYSREALELLFRVVGADNCLFGTEMPGTGTVRDPDSGRFFDDLRPVIEDIDLLTDEDREKVFSANALRLYRL
jgi:4-oxalmesaconate hydratase